MSDEMHDSQRNARDDAKPVTTGIARRDALKAIAAAAMVPMLPEAAAAAPMAPAARPPLPMLDEVQQAKRKGPRGTPSDPVLQVAKADWPNKLQLRELATLSALCDMIIPADAKSPNGKLRLLYEAAPMAFICEAAGGSASDGNRRILDIQPAKLHERTPLYVGSKDDVAVVERYLREG